MTQRSVPQRALTVDHDKLDSPLCECVRNAMNNYFAALDGHEARGVFDMVMGEVERPMLEAVLAHTEGNQTKAAELLGINRGTLRKKLRQHGFT